jgi:hypothetical protein
MLNSRLRARKQGELEDFKVAGFCWHTTLSTWISPALGNFQSRSRMTRARARARAMGRYF